MREVLGPLILPELTKKAKKLLKEDPYRGNKYAVFIDHRKKEIWFKPWIVYGQKDEPWFLV